MVAFSLNNFIVLPVRLVVLHVSAFTKRSVVCDAKVAGPHLLKHLFRRLVVIAEWHKQCEAHNANSVHARARYQAATCTSRLTPSSPR